MASALVELTREELYARVWATPIFDLAKEFGISETTIQNRCRKLNVPRPTWAFWTQKEHGFDPKPEPLPKEVKPPTLDESTVAGFSEWPTSVHRLCARAQALLKALQAQKPDYEGKVSIRDVEFPRVEISPKTLERAAEVFHAMLVRLESAGIVFRKHRGKYSPGYFEKGRDRLYLAIEETMKDPEAPYRNRVKTSTGKFQLSLTESEYGSHTSMKWLEGATYSLRDVVKKTAEGALKHFDDLEKKRQKEEEERKAAGERWQRQQEEEKKKQHEAALDRIPDQRKADFFRAVEWAHLYDHALNFIAACEARWTAAAPLTPEQIAWLGWARDAAESWSPWKSGYPDPTCDGAFDRASVAFGGPYPATRQFPPPPTMPEPKVESTPSYSSSPPKPYPFWLRHGR